MLLVRAFGKFIIHVDMRTSFLPQSKPSLLTDSIQVNDIVSLLLPNTKKGWSEKGVERYNYWYDLIEELWGKSRGVSAEEHLE
jgi:hypothetical protein